MTTSTADSRRARIRKAHPRERSATCVHATSDGVRALLAIGALFVLGSSDTPALAASQSGTGLTASVSTTRHFTITYTSSLAKSDDPATKMVAVRTSANMHWTITATRVRSGTLGGDVDFIGLS